MEATPGVEPRRVSGRRWPAALGLVLALGGRAALAAPDGAAAPYLFHDVHFHLTN